MSASGRRHEPLERPKSGALPSKLVGKVNGSFPGVAAQNLPFRSHPVDFSRLGDRRRKAKIDFRERRGRTRPSPCIAWSASSPGGDVAGEQLVLRQQRGIFERLEVGSGTRVVQNRWAPALREFGSVMQRISSAVVCPAVDAAFSSAAGLKGFRQDRAPNRLDGL